MDFCAEDTFVKINNINTLRATLARMIPIIAPAPIRTKAWPINQRQDHASQSGSNEEPACDRTCDVHALFRQG